MNHLAKKVDIGKSDEIIVSLSDFGGQREFGCIHHLFLTKGGPYIVVFSMKELVADDVRREKCLKDLNDWLTVVILYSSVKLRDSSVHRSSIILVGTRKDLVSDPADHSDINRMLLDKFGTNPLIRPYLVMNDLSEGLRGITNMCFFPIDNKKGREDPTLIIMLNKLEQEIKSSYYFKQLIPLIWLQILR
jgi:GTPase SAR1 family protein